MNNLETYFAPFRKNIIGFDSTIETPFGRKRLVYADWIASGRLYRSIESKIADTFGPMVGNTHSETTETGITMTLAYQLAHDIIKEHVNANNDDVIITAGSGMTDVVNKFQRILGLKISEQAANYCKLAQDDKLSDINIPEQNRPVVFITHIEHHSNQTSWLETIADVIVLKPDDNMKVSADALRNEIVKYKNRKLKIGAFSACSNVTGMITDYYDLAEIMHQYGGYCFIDYAASAPYEKMDMHPADSAKRLDAIYFSPHKFLGGPGSSGVLIFNKELYKNSTPDNPGGGTVKWTNRWGEHSYFDDIEMREDGGTPGFIQAFRIALSIKLKERMGYENIKQREAELIKITFDKLRKIDKLHILADNIENRLGVFSFFIDGVHHNLMVRLLNDYYGIQVRGGCSCAGTYGHFLLHVSVIDSNKIATKIEHGDLSLKPGWVRLSLHPTMTNEELLYILNAIDTIVKEIEIMKSNYIYSPSNNEFNHKNYKIKQKSDFESWFDVF